MQNVKILLDIYQIKKGSIIYKNKYNQNIENNKIGYIQQFPVLYPGSIYDNIFYYKDNILNKDKILMEELFTLFGFDEIIKQIFDNEYNDYKNNRDFLYKKKIFKRNSTILSGGQQQRLQIIRVCVQSIINHSKLIITDELTSAIDKNSANLIWKYLFEFSKKYNIMIVNFIHFNTLEEYRKFFDSKYIIKKIKYRRTIEKI